MYKMSKIVFKGVDNSQLVVKLSKDKHLSRRENYESYNLLVMDYNLLKNKIKNDLYAVRSVNTEGFWEARLIAILGEGVKNESVLKDFINTNQTQTEMINVANERLNKYNNDFEYTASKQYFIILTQMIFGSHKYITKLSKLGGIYLSLYVTSELWISRVEQRMGNNINNKVKLKKAISLWEKHGYNNMVTAAKSIISKIEVSHGSNLNITAPAEADKDNYFYNLFKELLDNTVENKINILDEIKNNVDNKLIYVVFNKYNKNNDALNETVLINTFNVNNLISYFRDRGQQLTEYFLDFLYTNATLINVFVVNI